MAEMQDARFREAAFSDRPLRLRAQTAEDLAVISALVQDSLARAGEVTWMPRRRRVAILLNRFRWEDADAAERDRRPYERVHACLVFDSVRAVQSNGLDPADRRAVISVLGIDFRPDDEAVGGRAVIALAGGGEIALEVECIEARLQDLTRPWEARSRRMPAHRPGERE